MKTKTIKIYKITQDTLAGSRYNGEIIRKLTYNEIQKGNKIILDFENINLITQGFADEIIGIFVRAFGVNFVKNNISVINANENIRRILNTVISYSKNSSIKQEIQALYT